MLNFLILKINQNSVVFVEIQRIHFKNNFYPDFKLFLKMILWEKCLEIRKV